MARKTISLFTVCLLLLAATRLYATTVERLGLGDMVKKAQSIVVGTVTGSRTYWSSDKKFILTDHTIEVNESIKGQTPRRIAITTIGGKIDDVELYVSGTPSFQTGETAVVFLEQ